MKLNNAKYQFRVENTEFKIPSLRFTFPINCFQNVVVSIYDKNEVNVNFLYPLKTTENDRFLMFSGFIKGNVNPKWVTAA